MPYKAVRTLPPDFWSAELRKWYDLWVLDMRQGMRPYTPRSAQNFERRFILYTRNGWEGKTESLSLAEVFDLANVYSIISQYPVESYSNRHNMLYSLVSFSKFLISMDMLGEGVLDKLRKLRPRRVMPPRKTVLRDETEIAALKQAIEARDYDSEPSRLLDRAVIETFLQTGLRISELCQLNLDDVEFEQCTLHVRLGKGRKSRKVGITKVLKAILTEYLSFRLQREIDEEQAFFLNHRRGTRLKAADVTRRLLKLSRMAGLSITAHGLRRSFATLHANQGKPLHLIQLALGHSDIRTTQEYLMSDEAQVIQAMKEW